MDQGPGEWSTNGNNSGSQLDSEHQLANGKIHHHLDFKNLDSVIKLALLLHCVKATIPYLFDYIPSRRVSMGPGEWSVNGNDSGSQLDSEGKIHHRLDFKNQDSAIKLAYLLHCVKASIHDHLLDCLSVFDSGVDIVPDDFPEIMPLPLETLGRNEAPSAHRVHCFEPNPADVVLGRGGFANNHVGNINYRAYIEPIKEEIRDTTDSKVYQGKIVQARKHDILEYVKITNGGRFLKEEKISEGEDLFVELEEHYLDPKKISIGDEFDCHFDGKMRRAKYKYMKGTHRCITFGFYEVSDKNALRKASQALREPWKKQCSTWKRHRK
jgi:hypothetical protein